MRHVPTLLRRELGAYFLNPMAYLILLAFQILAWLNFAYLVEALSRPRQVYSGLSDPMNTYISGSMVFWFAVLVAVSAPSSLARDLAQASNQTLIGFLRGRSLNVYSGRQRIRGQAR